MYFTYCDAERDKATDPRYVREFGWLEGGEKQVR